MIDPQTLLQDLRRLLAKLEQDILAYHETSGRREHLEVEYRKVWDAGRTAENFVDWRVAQVTQAAAAWLLTCVFVRFLEDNELLEESLLAGPAGPRLQHARDRITVHFREQPRDAERAYLLSVFEELERFPVLAELLDHRHNPLWQMPVSDDGARLIVDFFQRVDPESGALVHDFTDGKLDTRFLGDLYQDLSEAVRKRYALLQTPEFVERFILDYTLDKARDTFGLPGLRMIDPTCGSGHFLLGTFDRLFDAWVKREPGTNTRHLAQKALDAVHGVDINPYAVAIARFRLLIAAMQAAGSTRIKDAPDFHFRLAVGDSLYHGRRHEWHGQGDQQDAYDVGIRHVQEVEDRDKLERILGQRYHVVVGNPPYITVKDKALNQAYRDKYLTCHMKYSLGVPFTERFFDLCLPNKNHLPAGYVGMITTNSFMKREFGRKLIEEYLPTKNLTHVIDTSGAYIPGHGTPTVILFARNDVPQGDSIRAVLGIRGEPSTPEKAALGKVWSSIVKLLDKAGEENEFVSVADQPRGLYRQHPWSVGGGGASELKDLLTTDSSSALDGFVESIGITAFTLEDDVYVIPKHSCRVNAIPKKWCREMALGDELRDWEGRHENLAVFPYSESGGFAPVDPMESATVYSYLWPFRTNLSNSKMFGGKTKIESGLKWFEFGRLTSHKLADPLSITFAFVATHNHFVLDRGGKVFNRSAPVIKLPAGSTEADHLALLGLLNSSTGMFWMRQVFHGKGQGGVGQESRAEWEEFREFTGTGLKKFPIASDSDQQATRLATVLDNLGRSLASQNPGAILARNPDSTAEALEQAQADWERYWQKMLSFQEELDWSVYRLYGLIDEDLTYNGDPPPIRLGERPFEILLARLVTTGQEETTWFTRHNSTMITEPPTDWPADYRELTIKRMEVAQENRWIRLIEQPEYKRRWNREPWARKQERALRECLLDYLEQRCGDAELVTCAQLAERVHQDARVQQIAALYAGIDTFDAQALVSELVATDQVPQMAAARYKPNAMPKFRAWQETWRLQRLEDALDAQTRLEPGHPDYLDEPAARALKGEQVGDIPLPPKYAKGDFLRPEYWPLRGKLDVPKERFFSLPGCEKPGDTTQVIGWAGLNHLRRAQAIAAWYLDRKEKDGWNADQLLPMLVALDELVPWLKQWHNDIDREYGERLGDYYEGFLREELHHWTLSRDALADWTPAETRRRRQ